MSEAIERTGITVVVESLGDEPGIEIIDPIERRRYTLATPEPVSPRAADPDYFRYPVETAVTVETDAVSLPVETHVFVRDVDGRMLAEIEHGTDRTFPEGSYSLELNRLVKTYLRVDAPLEIRTNDTGTEIRFGGPKQLHIGVRSLHERPATTITTTADPSDIMETISAFGSALKTTTPERSFPTLRGHPPAVELGDELSIPDVLEPPSESIRVEVPPRLEYVYPVASLAYYLGAPLREGPRPRIVGEGFEYHLDDDLPFETAVERTLKRIFLLDCVTRTEGLYRVDLHERRRIEEAVDFSFRELYDLDPVDRLSAYLEVAYESIEPQMPDWKLGAHVEAVPETAEILPYLVDDLAVIRIARSRPVSASAIDSGAAQGLTHRSSRPTGGGVSRPERGASSVIEEDFLVPVDGINAIEEAWASDGTPLLASKVIPEAYRNRIGRTPSAGQIDISVVCNADVMADERDVVDDVYGSREDLPFDVTVHRDTTIDELADLLAEHRDFIHYIGHIDEDGFRCSDGRFDVSDLDVVGPDAFFLNACQSYEQGMELIRRGSIGGIVTLSDVVNHGAIRIGRAVSRLLNAGFPLKVALDIASTESVIGSQYIVVGDGSLSVIQPESGTPQMYHIDISANSYSISVKGFGAEPGMGSLYRPYIESNNCHFISTGQTNTFDLDKHEFVNFLKLENVPVRLDGQLTYSNQLLKEFFTDQL